LQQLKTQLDVAVNRGDHSEAVASASAALRIAPLDWESYYSRGVANVALHSNSDAQRDFAVARYLLPGWPDLYLKEGFVWLGVGQPDLAFEVWKEGIQRCPGSAFGLYSDIFGAVREDADLRERWRDLAGNNREYLLVFLNNAEPVEFEIESERLLEEDPDLRSFKAAQLKMLFAAWYKRGNKLALAEKLQQHPDWQKIAWRELAQTLADYQDYRQAYETVARFSPRPWPADLPRA